MENSLLAKNHLENFVNYVSKVALETSNVGLLNGKMGGAIFLYQYSRMTGNKIFEEIADKLIDEVVQKDIGSLPLNFDDGLFGISWGIEYLARNKFVDVDLDDVLSEVDSIVNGTLFSRKVSISNSHDLLGYGLYYLSRLKGREDDTDNAAILYKKQLAILMVDECERLLVYRTFQEVDIPYLSKRLINSMLFFLLEVNRLRLFPVKVKKMLFALIPYIENGKEEDCCSAEIDTMIQLVHSVCDYVKDENLQCNYRRIANLLIDQKRGDLNLVDYISTQGWHASVYTPYVTVNKSIIEKVNRTFNNDDNQMDDLIADANSLSINKMSWMGIALIYK